MWASFCYQAKKLCKIFFTLLHIKKNNCYTRDIKGTGRSEEVEISRNITFSEKILIESCGIWEDVDEIFCQNSS